MTIDANLMVRFLSSVVVLVSPDISLAAVEDELVTSPCMSNRSLRTSLPIHCFSHAGTRVHESYRYVDDCAIIMILLGSRD